MKFFTTLKAKIKLIIAAITGLAGIILYFFIEKKSSVSAREHLTSELNRIENATNIAKQEADSKERKQKLEGLKEEELTVRAKIDTLNKMETDQKRDVSIEELDAFFDQRGF